MKIFRLRNKVIILVLLATLLAYGCFVEPFRLKIEHLSYDYTLSDKKITVVQFSDLHLRFCYDIRPARENRRGDQRAKSRHRRFHGRFDR